VGMKKILSILTFSLLFTAAYAQSATFLFPSNAPPTVRLQWDPSPDASVVGYTLYYGVGSRQYTNRTSVGNITNVTSLLPTRNQQFFFAVTAYNSAGLESDFSNEASYFTPRGIFPPGNLKTNVVQLAFNVEKSDNPSGPWVEYATMGTDLTAPGFFRGVVRITREIASAAPPIPGEPAVLRLTAPPALPTER